MTNDYFKKFSNSLPLMQGREQASLNDVCNQILHFQDFGFVTTRNGECAVATFAEFPQHFFFCNQVVTDMLHTVENDGQAEALPGVGVEFTKKFSQVGREYLTFEFMTD